MNSRILLIVMILLSLVGCKNDRTILLGDAYLLNNLIDCNSNSDFVFSKMTSQNFYYYLDKDALSLESNKRVSSLIKRANKIVLSFGIYDLIPLFDFSKKEITYNKDQIENKLELMDYYIYSSFQILNDLIDTRDKVYILKQYNPLVYNFDNLYEFEGYIVRVNDILFEYASKNEFSFIEIDTYDQYLLDDFILDVSINEEIRKKIQ